MNKGLFDTTTIIFLKDSLLKNSKSGQIILIQDKKREEAKSWLENPLIVSLLIPIIVSALTILITRYINRKKEKKEQEKITVEIKKLQAENEQIKKSFQPIVISSLQTIQSELLKVKIEALKRLNELKEDFFSYEQPLISEELYEMAEEDYFNEIYYKFNFDKDKEYKNFLLKYSYVFPDSVIDKLTEVSSIISDIYRANSTIDDPEFTLGQDEFNQVKKLISAMDISIKALRSDLHLDNDFIHKFIQQNQSLA